MLAPASFSLAGRVRGASGRPLRSGSRGPTKDPPRSSRRVALRGARLGSFASLAIPTTTRNELMKFVAPARDRANAAPIRSPRRRHCKLWV